MVLHATMWLDFNSMLWLYSPALSTQADELKCILQRSNLNLHRAHCINNKIFAWGSSPNLHVKVLQISLFWKISLVPDVCLYGRSERLANSQRRWRPEVYRVAKSGVGRVALFCFISVGYAAMLSASRLHGVECRITDKIVSGLEGSGRGLFEIPFRNLPGGAEVNHRNLNQCSR
jgi:hypothetical protein